MRILLGWGRTPHTFGANRVTRVFPSMIFENPDEDVFQLVAEKSGVLFENRH